VHVPNQPSHSNKFIPEVRSLLYGLILNLLWEFGTQCFPGTMPAICPMSFGRAYIARSATS